MAEDSRITRTKKAIKMGFISLLDKKEIDLITVKDIALAAGVDRKTVYNYYPGVYALIDEVEQDFIKTIEEHSKLMRNANIVENPLEFFDEIKDDILNNLKLYKNFLNVQSNSNLLLRLTKIIENNVENTLKENLKINGINPNNVNLKLCATFITDGMIGCCRGCMEGIEDNPEQFIKGLTALTVYGTLGFFWGMPKK